MTTSATSPASIAYTGVLSASSTRIYAFNVTPLDTWSVIDGHVGPGVHRRAPPVAMQAGGAVSPAPTRVVHVCVCVCATLACAFAMVRASSWAVHAYAACAAGAGRHGIGSVFVWLA